LPPSHSKLDKITRTFYNQKQSFDDTKSQGFPTEKKGGFSLFNIGDCAVYPAHGLAFVKRIEEKDMGNGNKKSFYVLEILATQATILIPTEQQGRLRKIISLNDVHEVYAILKEKDVRVDQTTWNRRNREYSEKIKSGSIFEIAEVMRNLFLLRHSKDLSFGERKLLDQAKGLIVKEVSIARQSKESDIEKEIQAIFAS
jgi:CarD family transcriptional regulator